MRTGLVALSLAGALASARFADAAPTAFAPEARTGAYARGAVGMAYGGWRISSGRFSGLAWGEAVQGSAAVGWAFIDGLAFAAEARGFFQGGSASAGWTWSAPEVLVVGGVVDYFPHPTGSLHVELGFGAMRGQLSGPDITELVSDNTRGVDEFERLSGVFAHGGVGWAWPLSGKLQLGPAFGLYRGRASNGGANFDLYGGSLELALTWR